MPQQILLQANFDSTSPSQIVNIYLNDTFVKESSYAIASLGISSFFLISFIIYLTVFIGFLLTEQFRKACSDCTKKEESNDPNSGISKPSSQEQQVDERTNSSTNYNTPTAQYYSGWKKSHSLDDTSKINKNQKIMFILVLALVVVQCFALTSRMVSDSMSLIIKDISPNALNESTVVAFFLFSCAELGLTFGNMITTILIMCFVQHVFGIIVTISIGLFLVKLNAVRDFLVTLYVMCFVIDSTMIILETVLFNFFGYMVVRTINRQSTKTQRDQTKLCVKRKHFAKIIILQGALSFCALLQLLAVVFESIAKSTKTPGIELAYYFVNSFGILSFAVVVLFLYNPLFNYPANKMKIEEATDFVKEMLQTEPTTPTSPYFPKNSARSDTSRRDNQFLGVPGVEGSQYLSAYSESFGGSSTSLDSSTSCDSSTKHLDEEVRIEEVIKPQAVPAASITQILDSQQ
nr:unnamed protein product [Naegleria fowleri]